MPLADLYGVTATLRNLVRLNIRRIANLNVIVTDLPPEKAEEGGAVTSTFIYSTLSRICRSATSFRVIRQAAPRSPRRRCRSSFTTC